MPETITGKHRSWIMSRIRSKDTKPELIIRSVLHRCGYRFSLKRKDLPGKPDIVLPKYNAVVFVNGCFWHWHQDINCHISKIPKSNSEKWRLKFTRNAELEKENVEKLLKMGWRVFTIWECEIMYKPEEAISNLLKGISGAHNNILQQIDIKETIDAVIPRHKALLKTKTGSLKFYENTTSKTD